jgi:hypothetical protein
VRRFPEFDEKKLGYTGFKRLMARVAQNGNIRLITAGLVDWAIMSDEDIPEGATEATFSGGGSNSRPGRRRGRLPRSRQQDENRTPEHVSSEIDDTSVIEDTENNYEPISEPEPVNGNQTNGWQDRDDQSESSNQYSSDRDREEIRSEEQTEEPSEPVSPFGDNLELARALQEAINNLDMPKEPDDGMLADRVSDLIFMANTLENQEGISHVAFNFLVSEICEALGQGLEAGHADITQRWGQSSSRTYVSKILRSLSDGEFFLKGNHSWRDETSGQNRRRRTFNLNQEHPLVQQTISARSGDSPDSAGQESSYDSDQNDPPQDSGDSPRNSNDFARSVAADYADPNNNGEDEKSSVQPGNERLPLFTDEEDDDYESGKSAAEARAETGFISRLFRPRRN